MDAQGSGRLRDWSPAAAERPRRYRRRLEGDRAVNLWYAVNARDLLETRHQRMKPRGPVIVSTIGGDFGRLAGATLYVHDDMPAERLDWRMLADLEAWLWADDGVAVSRVLTLLDGIARARPRRLCLRFDKPWSWVSPGGREYEQNTHDVDIGTGFHTLAIRELPDVHEFHWDPFPLNWTPIEHRLAAAATTKHPRGTVL